MTIREAGHRTCLLFLLKGVYKPAGMMVLSLGESMKSIFHLLLARNGR